MPTNGVSRVTTTLVALVALIIITSALASDAGAEVVISPGKGPGQVEDPAGVAVDTSEGDPSSGNLYVADRLNNRVDVFDSSGTFVRAFGWGVSTGAEALQVCTTTCRAGLAGSRSGQFEQPNSIAVDNDPSSPSFHDVYVFDRLNLRVEKFSPSGTFLLMFGGGVNQTTGGNVCVAGTGDVCGAGSQGEGVGQFGFNGRPLTVGPEGMVYVLDAQQMPGGVSNRIEKFDGSGTFVSQIPIAPPGEGELSGRNALAVESNGDIYLRLRGGLRKYDANGTLLNVNGNVGGPQALSLDGAGHLFTAETEGPVAGQTFWPITELDSSGDVLRRFGYGVLSAQANGVAPFVSGDGDIYDAEELAGGASGRIVHVSIPPAGPLVVPGPCDNTFIGSRRATITCLINPEGKQTTLHFKYVDGKGMDHETPESSSIGEDFRLHAAPLSLGVMEPLEPETTYHYQVVATNEDGGPVAGDEGTFTTKEPLEIGNGWASKVDGDSAQLNAEVNPLESPAEGFFEYVDQASFEEGGFAGALRTPASPEEINFGAGEDFRLGTTEVTGLTPGTTYHFRLAARDDFTTTPRHGAEGTFFTFAPGQTVLPDGRGYELVSTPMDEGQEAGSPGASGGTFDALFQKIQQSAATGERMTFTSFTAFADPKSAPGTSQYFAQRGPDGWAVKSLIPEARGGNPLFPPYRGFAPELSFGGVVVQEPALTPEASPGVQNLYLKESIGGGLRTLTSAPPVVSPETKPIDYCVGFAGATEDGSRAFFIASGKLTPDALVPGLSETGNAQFNLYEWSAAEGLKLVSILPSGTPAKPATGTGFGSGGTGCSDGGSAALRHAISLDGHTVFWTDSTRLFARINGNETVQIDARQGGKASGGGQYLGASADGSKAVFTDPTNELVPGATKGDLYRYDFDAPEGERLTDMTLTPGGADVRGVVGISEDASYIYFVANGVLAAGAEPGTCGSEATAPKCNLYLWHGGEPIKFIAALSEADNSDWEGRQAARVSPDGKSLAFVSKVRLTGYDNTVEGRSDCRVPGEDATSEEVKSGLNIRCSEAYFYDAESAEISCASCSPSGARPLGPMTLSQFKDSTPWGSPFEPPRNLSTENGRLFFRTADSLDPHDTNGHADVYEFELPGVGSCTAGNANFSPVNGGCVFLISTGTNSDDSFFIDASADGRDVFFSTRAALVGQDEDERYDVYDARIGGGFPEPPRPPIACEGEACKGPAPAAPAGPSPATPNFEGPGNPKAPKSCKKGFVRKHGKCVKQKHHKKKQKPHKKSGGRKGGGK